MKTLFLTSAAAAVLALAAAPVQAAGGAQRFYAAPAATPYSYVAGRAYRSPFAFPRGVSYGTGYNGAGTATGGPAGGLPSRN